MADTLFVPIHLDALVLAQSRLSVGPSARFERLPHLYGGVDVNADVPNLGKSVVAAPFQDETFLLEAGIHLHWALPDGLTRATHTATEQRPSDEGHDGAGASLAAHEDRMFPAVPNRWHVVRFRDTGGRWQADKQWLVESDYLWDDNTKEAAASVSVPSRWSDEGLDEQKKQQKSKRPYRFMGRQKPWNIPPDRVGDTYLNRPLTALGYGEPTFAAVYQNCQFVFGFHDDDVLGPREKRRYDVCGWYHDAAQDPLRAAVNSMSDPTARAKAVEARFGWRVADQKEIPAGTEIVCFVSMEIDGNRTSKSSSNEVELAVGNTGSEALSAYLAGTIDGGNRRETVEDQLESILLVDGLAGKTLDLAARLADARHEKGFVATFGGWIWMVKAEEPAVGTPHDAARAPEAPLDPTLGVLLTELNGLEREYDEGLRTVEAARGQLFVDWCKYMRVVYPSDAPWHLHETFDADRLRQFIEERETTLLTRQAAALGELWLEYDRDRDGNPRNVTGAKASPDASATTPTMAFALAEKIKQALKYVADVNQERMKHQVKPFVLQRIPGPRFYRPTEPALLIQGEAVRATERHGQDGRDNPDDMLECDLFATDVISRLRDQGDSTELWTLIDSLRTKKGGGDRIGFCRWQKPWHPILLEWEVDLFPIDRSGHRGCDEYAEDHLERHYAFAAGAVELTTRQNVAHDNESQNKKTYRGCSILTSHARHLHDDALRAYIVEHSKCSLAELDTDHKKVEAAYRDRPGVKRDDPVLTAFRALEVMAREAKEGKGLLSLALTGFNDALLGLHQSYQLPIEDPLGFACEQEFAERVALLVGSHNRNAPDDAGGFDPIRGGHLVVKRLRLVDTFGQIMDLKFGEPHASCSLRANDGHRIKEIVLPPRFVQPARLNLRWLSTTDGKTETSALPTSTPICGWVVLDNLDRSLLVYDAGGRALGVISNGKPVHVTNSDEQSCLWQAGWQAAPGEGSVERVWNIADAGLQSVAAWLVQQAEVGDWTLLLDQIEAALGNIDPEGFAHHEDLAVLMGRPLAVVRAQLSVALCGPPAIHQGRDALFIDMQSNSRRTDQFEGVTIPIRLGADARLHDGLVAYWRETDKGLGAKEFWPQTDKELAIHLSPASGPHTLTMLVDPLAAVHATTGLLPAKSITIPASMYAAALKGMDVTFRSLGPILTRMGRLDLPLPVEPGYEWSWIERDDRGWTAVASDVGATADDGAFSGPIVARAGWLQLTKTKVEEPGAP